MAFIHIGPTITAKPVDPVSAESPFSVGKVIGRQIPIVVGTGKVDGIPVIGGAASISTVTGYNQVKLTTLQGLRDVGGTAWLNNDPFSRVALVPISGSQQVAALGYLLAYDPFGAGYKLIRVEINDTVVYDAENGIGASENFRFYGGNQTAPDRITDGVIGAQAGAWQNFAMLYLDGYAATSAPSVKCVISNAATDSGGNRAIAWTSTHPNDFTDVTGYGEAYDAADGVIYHLLTRQDLPGLSHVYLSVLDTQTLTERYRIPLVGSDDYVTQRQVCMAIRGSGFVLVRFSRPGFVGYNRVYNASTGSIIAQYAEPDGVELRWIAGQVFGQKYVFMGFNFHDFGGLPIYFAVVDLAAQSLTITEGGIAYADQGCRGRNINGSVSFFSARFEAPGEIWEHTFNGDAWTSALVYTDTDVNELSVLQMHFDPLTGYLVVASVTASELRFLTYVNPADGSIIDRFAAPDGLGFLNSLGPFWGFERFWPQPGFVFSATTSAVTLLDIKSKALTPYSAPPPDGSTENWLLGAIFDQARSSYLAYHDDDHWTDYRQPSTIPGAVSLRWILEKVMFLAGYAPDDLIFDGDFGSPGEGGGGGGDGGGDDHDAVASIDFIAGAYTVNGVTVTAADVVAHPELITENGLELLEDADTVDIIGDLLALLLTASWTIVLEWDHLDATGRVYPMALVGAGDDNVVQIRRLESSHYMFVEDFGGAGYRGVADTFAFGDGVHKIALTRTNAKLVFSADGRPLSTGDIDDFALTPTGAAFGGYPGWSIGETMHIKSLKVYAPINDADLPALSA